MRTKSQLLLLFLLTSCDTGDLTLPDRPPPIEGVVVARDAAGFTKPNVHIREGETDCGVVFEITDQTVLVRRTSGGGLEEADLAGLTNGRPAAAWPNGIVIETCPAQGEAEAIELR